MPGPNSAPVRHRLTGAELASLARGRFTTAVIGRLIAAELSKHRLLVEAVRRRAHRARPPDDLAAMDSAMRLLGQIETHSPEIVAKILALPHVGSWAIDCLRKMPVGNGAEQADAAGRAPLRLDLGYLVAVAAAAALRARPQFDPMRPRRDGVFLLPRLGPARLPSRQPSHPPPLPHYRDRAHTA